MATSESLFRARVGAAFVEVMRRRRPDLRWRLLTEDERKALKRGGSDAH